MRRLLLLLMLLVPATSLAADLDLWFPHVVTLTGADSGNVYLNEDVTCTFTHTTAASITVPGFWDGGDIWICRMAPTAVGFWSWTSASATDTGLDGDSGSFTAVAGSLPGFIERDGIYDWKTSDGTPLFLMGDTCWRCMITDRYTDADFTAYINARAGQNFNVIRGYFSSQGRSAGDDDNSGSGITGGANESYFDADTIVPAYWRKIDERLQEANDAGIAWNIVAGGDGSSYYEGLFDTAARRERYLLMLVARYAAFNIMWDGVAEDDEHSDYVSLIRELGEIYEDNDPYQHPRGSHPGVTAGDPGDSKEWSGEDWFEFISYQGGEDNGTYITDRSEQLPIVNEEFCYEFNCYTAESSSHNCSSATTRNDGWRIAMAGASMFVGNVGTYTGGSRPYDSCALTDTGISDYEWIYNFFGALPLSAMTPDNSLVSAGFAYSDEDTVYAVWSESGSSFTMDMSGSTGTFSVNWMDPGDGSWTAATDESGHTSAETFIKPDSSAWALLVTKTATPADDPDRHVFLDTNANGVLNDCPSAFHSCNLQPSGLDVLPGWFEQRQSDWNGFWQEYSGGVQRDRRRGDEHHQRREHRTHR